MFTFDEFLADYLTKGFYCFDGSWLLSSFPIDAFMPIKTGDRMFKTRDLDERLTYYTTRQQALLRDLAMDIQAHYFHDIRMEMHFSDMWSRVGENVHGWHSDFMNDCSIFNSSLNCYFDDSSEETGGQLQFHPAGQDIPENSPMLNAVYPKKFNIVVLNQNTNFVHRVTHCSIERRMLSYVCAFLDFNPPNRV